MSESTRCPKCGIPLPADAPAGLCPKCLVQAGFESEPLPQSKPAPTSSSPASSGFQPPSVEELAAWFPQLEILELLGKGGMGAVYKARQPGLDRLVALKILPPEISHDPAFAERFQREARALARLNHPHIVAVHDFGKTPAPLVQSGRIAGGDGSLCYFVMEFVEGANLRHTIRTGALTSAEALAIVPQICEALQFAHDEGIVHRDIKPENILIDKRGRVKIADFGLAKLLGSDASDHSLTATHQVMGTMRYMAPEQMQGSREVDHRADIYSLGVVFYELLTGELPMGKFAPPSKKVRIDVRLDEIVLRALEQAPEQRYQHASQIKSDVESVTSKSIVPVAKPAKIVLPDPHSARFCLLALVGAIWAPLFFIATIAAMVTNRAAEGKYSGPAWWQLALAFTLLPLGMLAPFGTTILGVVSIARIKNSEGRLYGLGLAAADALLFPLLVLFATITGGLALVLHSLLPIQLVVAGVLAAMVASIVCFFVGRAAWRAIHPVSTETTGNGWTPTEEELRSRLRLAGICLLIAGIMDAFCGLLWIGQNVSILVALLQQGAPFAWQLAHTALSLCSLMLVYYVIGVAQHLMTLEDDGDFTFCLVIAAITPPGCLIGLPAAIYSMVQLSKPEVKSLLQRTCSTPAMTSDEAKMERRAASAARPESAKDVVMTAKLEASLFADSGHATPPSGIGSISLGAAIAGVVLPALLLVGGIVLSTRVSIPDGFVASCFLLGVGLELVAVGCGIVTQCTKSGKAGLIISSISLVLWLATLWIIPTRVSMSEHQPEVVTETGRITPVIENGSPANGIPVTVSSSGWIVGPVGPVLTDAFGRQLLKLQPAQIEQVNTILQAIYPEYPALEAQHTEQHTDEAGHIVVRIKPFPKKIAELENRLWSQLDAILDPQQQSVARLNLKLDPPEAQPLTYLSEFDRPGFFGWGKQGAYIEIWRVGAWYHWKVQSRGIQDSSRAAQLPQGYRRFWKELATDDEQIQGA